jgi:hypothetical protein
MILSVIRIFDYLTYETKYGKELWISTSTNEACIPLRTIHEKDFDYTEILCEDGTRMTDRGSDGFRVIRP